MAGLPDISFVFDCSKLLQGILLYFVQIFVQSHKSFSIFVQQVTITHHLLLCKKNSMLIGGDSAETLVLEWARMLISWGAPSLL